MTQRRRMLLRVGMPAGGAAVLALAISLVLALTSSAAPGKAARQARAVPAPARVAAGAGTARRDPAVLAVHRRAGPRAQACPRGEDRQHRGRPAANRAPVRRPHLRAAGRGRPHPVHGGVLLARPAGGRPGAQRPRGRPGHPEPVRAARVRLVRRDPAPGAVHRAGPGRRPLRAPGRRLLPGFLPGRAAQPVRQPAGPADRRRGTPARRATSGSGSARPPPAGGPSGRTP